MPLVAIDDTELFYDLTGPEGAPVLALSNSLGSTMEMWETPTRLWADTFRVLRYDTRGHGRSKLGTAPVTIERLADDMAVLLKALGIAKAHVAGLSLGGMTAQAVAIRHGALVDRLFLMATGPYLPTQESWNARAVTVRDQGMGAVADAVLARWFTGPFAAEAPEVVAYHRGRFLSIDPAGYAACCEAIGAMDLRPDLSKIAAPTMIIAGSEDPVTNVAMGEEMKAAIKGAVLKVVPAAHLLATERAKEVAALVTGFAGASPVVGSDFAKGLSNRKAVLGVDHVQRSLEKAGPFALPWQDFITRTAWGEIWGDPTLPWKTRSLITLSLMIALGREEEFKLHLRPARKNGVSFAELRTVIKQAAVYAGVPAANAAFRWTQEVFGAELDQPDAE